MRVIILAGYRKAREHEAPWLDLENGVAKLEARVREALTLTQNCVVVLAGESADGALMNCPSLEKCELVFDPRNDQASLLTNLRAGLVNGDGPAVVLPAELEFGSVDNLKQLIALAVQQGLRSSSHFLHSEENPFPLVLTAQGSAEILQNKNLVSLADPRLSRHVP